MEVWFSFILAGGSIFGLWLVSKNAKAGWSWCLFMEIPWSIWAIWLGQWGFLVLCLAYAGVYLNNLIGASKMETVEYDGVLAGELLRITPSIYPYVQTYVIRYYRHGEDTHSWQKVFHASTDDEAQGLAEMYTVMYEIDDFNYDVKTIERSELDKDED